ncbi:hypothetical protein C8R43DRAFT_1200674 [Mycena crocata]|nr:hypothetical protein C8R43DRAFT_1200674 [Mycena crocata]
MTMHRALDILEIVELICEQVDERCTSVSYPFRGGIAPRELAILARTSSVFHNPALNVLWRHQETIVNLLRTMPDGLWSITTEYIHPNDGIGEENTNLAINLRRAILCADWERPLCYISRVKRFSLDNQYFESSDFFGAMNVGF